MHEYCSPKIEPRQNPEKGGWGLYAREPIHAGEVLLVWGGAIIPWTAFQHLPSDIKRYSIQVEEDLFLVPQWPPEASAFINHSCAPNAGLLGQITLVAMRDIAPDEEICYDYAMSDGLPYDEFECHCGTPTCRGRVTGEDWRKPELWFRYAGYFSPYLQRRIHRLLGLTHEPMPGILPPLAARRFYLVTGTGSGQTYAEAKAQAMMHAGIEGTTTLLPVFPVVPPKAKRYSAQSRLRGIPFLPAAYTWAWSTTAGERFALAIAVAHTDIFGYGVVLAARGSSQEEAVSQVERLAGTLLDSHWHRSGGLEIAVAQSEGGPISCIFAACIYM